MFFKWWEILVVDDEPDVLSVSKLAMKNFEVYGLPVKIHTAGSKAEAIKILGNASEFPVLSIALVDVVMETETAGLELCEYIREDKGNKHTQLFIRTGQPGIAPEREVIDHYDISGYFTKVEATEDKLCSMTKTGVRQFLWSWYWLALNHILQTIIAASSRERLVENIRQVHNKMFCHVRKGKTTPLEIFHLFYSIWINGNIIAISGWDWKTAMELRNQLNKLESTALSPHRDQYVKDGNNLLIKIGSQPSKAEIYILLNMPCMPPDIIISTMFYNAYTSISILWERLK